jgi:hypothetical protein
MSLSATVAARTEHPGPGPEWVHGHPGTTDTDLAAIDGIGTPILAGVAVGQQPHRPGAAGGVCAYAGAPGAEAA